MIIITNNKYNDKLFFNLLKEICDSVIIVDIKKLINIINNIDDEYKFIIMPYFNKYIEELIIELLFIYKNGKFVVLTKNKIENINTINYKNIAKFLEIKNVHNKDDSL